MKKKPAAQSAPKPPTDQIYVGTFPLGFENVELYALTNDSGGYFYTRPDERSPSRVKIGISLKDWEDVVSVTLHETFELAMQRLRVRLETSGVRGDHASYTFVFSHCQFTELCQMQAAFITPALPALSAVFNKHHKLN